MIIIVAIALTSLALTLIARLCLFRLLKKTPPSVPLPPISILKPLKGHEDGLEQNLVALAIQVYPDFEIICGAADADDPALEIARQVASRYPGRFTIVSGAPDIGLNPKVSNLAHLSRHAKHRHWLISDANVRPRPGYLTAIGRAAGAGADLVHSPLVGEGGASLGGVLEDLHLGAWVVSAITIASELADHPCVIGKSMLLSRDALLSVGGFAAVSDVLAEDYLLGQRFKRAGFEVVLSPHVLPVRSGRRPLGDFWNRHLRWSQMRRRISPVSYVFEPMLSPLPWLLLALGSSSVVATALVFWLALEIVTLRALRGEWPSFFELALIPLKEILVLALWLIGAGRRKVMWRGKEMQIGTDSVLEAPAYAEA
jgi:ceramide glucosyltransferase